MAKNNTVYDPTYHPESVVELMAKGYLDYDLAAEWNISTRQLINWKHEHPEFLTAYEQGLAKSEQFYSQFLKEMIKGVNYQGRHSFNAAIAILNNKFKWAKKEGESTSNSTQININQMNVLQQQSNEELVKYIQYSLQELSDNNIIDATIVPSESDEPREQT